MPFKSQAQQRYMYANKEKMERQGVDVQEWSDSTDYKHLPAKSPKPPEHTGKMAEFVQKLGETEIQKKQRKDQNDAELRATTSWDFGIHTS